MSLLPLALVLCQSVPFGAPVPSMDSLAFEPREPTAPELLLVEMCWIDSPIGPDQFQPDSGMVLLLHGIGDGSKADPVNLEYAQAWFDTEMDRGLALVSVIQAASGSITAAQWIKNSGVRHPVATVPVGDTWSDSTQEGVLTLVSRSGILLWRGTDLEEAMFKLQTAYLWPEAPKPGGIPPPVLGEAWARYHDGQWADARALATEAGATPSVGEGVVSQSDFLALIDRHEGNLLAQVRALPASPELHGLVTAAKLREALMRGFPGSSATKEVLTWFGSQRKREGGSARLRLVADWVAIAPQRPLGYPRQQFLNRDDLRTRLQSIIQRAKGTPLSRYADALLKMRP